MDIRLPNTKVRGDELEDLLSSVGLYNEVEVVSRSVQVRFDQANARGLSVCFQSAQEFFIRSYSSGWTVLSRVFMIKYKQQVYVISMIDILSTRCRSVPIANLTQPSANVL